MVDVGYDMCRAGVNGLLVFIGGVLLFSGVLYIGPSHLHAEVIRTGAGCCRRSSVTLGTACVAGVCWFQTITDVQRTVVQVLLSSVLGGVCVWRV